MGLFSRKKQELEGAEEAVTEVDMTPTEDIKVLRDVVSEMLDESAQPSTTASQELEEEFEDVEWLADSYEGQLSVDVYQTETDVVIVSAIAGVRSQDLDVSIDHDVVTIKGVRRARESVDTESYFLQECHWGGFSRTIILPVAVREESARASLQNGILEVKLAKAGKERARVIPVQGDSKE